MPRVWRATPLHPLLHRRIGSDPAEPRAPGRRRAPRKALATLQRRRRGRHLSRGTVQRERPARCAACPASRCSRCAPGVPVVPAGIRGTYEALAGRRMYLPRRRPLARAVRDAASIRGSARAGGRAARDQVTRRIMDDIAALAAMSTPERALARARFGAADPTAARFTGSLAFDQRLWPHDIVGSAAWARALARAGLLTEAERDRIVAGLETVRAELAGGTFAFRRELEDIHMNVERRLLELVGEVGGKLHTGRSRNDQIALDERLYLKEVGGGHRRQACRRCQRALVARAAETVDTPMPGYTHLQRAQPIVLAHHLLAYVVHAAARPRAVRGARAARADVLPLGAAGAGRRRPSRSTARRWPATSASPRHAANSLDAVSRSRLHPRVSWPPPPSPACTSRGWPPISRCGPPRSSASWSSPTPSPPARRSCRRRRTPTWPS